MELLDFNRFPKSNRVYGGSERKIGILVGQDTFMLKFPKRTPFGQRFNAISEYLGSHIFRLLGIDCQQTYLGTYEGAVVVACKDFVPDGFAFVPFNDIGESTIEEDRDRFQYSYTGILKLLQANRKLTHVKETISTFFDIFIVDAFLGNFDRHGANWGFLKKDGKYTLAPVFDNGSCLYPAMVDEGEMQAVMNDESEIDRRVYDFPTSQILLRGRKSSYFQVISSLRFQEVNKALERIYPRIDLDSIVRLIESVSILSPIHRKFYETMIRARYDKILRFSYQRLKGARNEDL